MPGVMKFQTLQRDKVPEEIHAPLVKLVSPHIDSFDFFLNHALPKAVTVCWSLVVMILSRMRLIATLLPLSNSFGVVLFACIDGHRCNDLAPNTGS